MPFSLDSLATRSAFRYKLAFSKLNCWHSTIYTHILKMAATLHGTACSLKTVTVNSETEHSFIKLCTPALCSMVKERNTFM